jgi:predicted ATPase
MDLSPGSVMVPETEEAGVMTFLMENSYSKAAPWHKVCVRARRSSWVNCSPTRSRAERNWSPRAGLIRRRALAGDETLEVRMEGRIQIDRFAAKNFRSIQECDVDLAPLTFFIGANSSGKTSFVDAILFVASALRDSLEKAIAGRGGIRSILHQPIELPASSQFDFYLSSSTGFACEFHLELRVAENWSVSVAREECRVRGTGGDHHYYLVKNGNVEGSAAVFPPVSSDRIFLSNASGLPEFRAVFDVLAGIVLTEPTPSGMYYVLQGLSGMIRRLNPEAEERGLAARFRHFMKSQPDRLEIVQQYLRAIAPPFDRIEVDESADGVLWLRFVERARSGTSVPFNLAQASAGLVNAAEILLELFEAPEKSRPASPVVVEEPEAFLHPGAIQVIRDSFLEASRTRQVLVTTHSPELLDDSAVPAEWIRSVYRDENGTHVGVLDPATRSVIRDQLYTPGQLLRQGGLILKS